MLSTLLVIGGAAVGLLVLLVLIVSLSARPARARAAQGSAEAPEWVLDHGRRHPDAWAPQSSTEIRAVR